MISGLSSGLPATTTGPESPPSASPATADAVETGRSAANPQTSVAVPTLVHGDRVIYESAAILMYLCEAHPLAGLMPLAGEPDRGAFLQWLFWFTNTLQEDLQHWWHADNYLDTEPARLAQLGEIINWTNPGPGGFYYH